MKYTILPGNDEDVCVGEGGNFFIFLMASMELWMLSVIQNGFTWDDGTFGKVHMF